MIRHYEKIGLIPTPERSFAGYRLYSDGDVHRLHIVKRSREFGFSIRQIQTLLSLWDNRSRTSAEVKQLALAHSAELGARIREMEVMREALEDLAHRCHGDDSPDCPILEDLAAGSDCCAHRDTPAKQSDPFDFAKPGKASGRAKKDADAYAHDIGSLLSRTRAQRYHAHGSD